MRRFMHQNGLGITIIACFLVIWLGGQTTSGYRTYNHDRVLDDKPTISFVSYLGTAHFGEATFENWESEFLQMGMYVVLTVKLRQKGSAESKPLDHELEQDENPKLHQFDPDAPWPVRRGGAWLAVYRNSLSLALFALFTASFLLHAWTGSREYNYELASANSAERVTTWSYLTRSQFWFESLQNWQSEFLAVAAIVLLTIFLRQHGSPESKPVHAPHAATG
ncbi:MAG TPA: hypothetical protein PK020_03120 [Ilumatobacteraceae bacterium]|nr:hypothetical protein [Ilumatobacteraceae bacterium]HRB03301.1 hypothetical protein [Ilumatobacteraceae bacterium]